MIYIVNLTSVETENAVIDDCVTLCIISLAQMTSCSTKSFKPPSKAKKLLYPVVRSRQSSPLGKMHG